MNKKAYLLPTVKLVETRLSATYLLSASQEGIGDGGEGDDEDDPTAKRRHDGWGSLW